MQGWRPCSSSRRSIVAKHPPVTRRRFNQVNIDLDQVLDVALRGVRRASMFMGFGVNAAIDDELIDYQLTKLTNIQLLPSHITPENLAEAKNEFRLWIEANGFRELIESFHAYLDATHLAALKFRAVQKKEEMNQIGSDHSKFLGQGFPNKLNILEQNFGIAPEHRSHLISLNSARNVFTHRQSIVLRGDLNTADVMRVSWLGHDIFVQESNGQRHPINEVIEQERSFPEETSVIMEINVRERDFRVGDRLQFSSRDLAEICLFFTTESRSMHATLIRYAEKLGLEIKKK